MSEYVDFHYMPLEGKITGKQVLKQTEDAINDLGNKVYNLDIDQSKIDEAIEKSEQAIDTADSALAAVTTDRAVWKNTVAEMKATDIDLGVTAATRGKMVFNDGNGAFYGVRSKKSGDVDSDDTVFLNNGNVAERIQSMNIIAKGNNIIFVANVAELIDSDARIGNVYGTTGYYSANDGGSSVYAIRTKTQSDVDDGGSIIFLDNGNVAELITDGTVNVKQFGAKGDGIADDSTPLQNAVNFADKVIIIGTVLAYNVTISKDIYITGGELKATLTQYNQTKNILNATASGINITIDGVKLNGGATSRNNGSASLMNMFRFENSGNVVIKNCEICNHSQSDSNPDETAWYLRRIECINIIDADNVIFENNYIHDNHTEQIAIGSNPAKTNLQIVGNRCDNNTNAYALFLIFNVRNGVIADNDFRDNGTSFFNYCSSNLLFIGNRLVGTSKRGIGSEMGGRADRITNITIQDNYIESCSEGGIDCGIQNCSIINNTLIDCCPGINMVGRLNGDSGGVVTANSLPWVENVLKDASGSKVIGNTFIDKTTSDVNKVHIVIKAECIYINNVPTYANLSNVIVKDNISIGDNFQFLYFAQTNIFQNLLILNNRIENINNYAIRLGSTGGTYDVSMFENLYIENNVFGFKTIQSYAIFNALCPSVKNIKLIGNIIDKPVKGALFVSGIAKSIKGNIIVENNEILGCNAVSRNTAVYDSGAVPIHKLTHSTTSLSTLPSGYHLAIGDRLQLQTPAVGNNIGYVTVAGTTGTLTGCTATTTAGSNEVEVNDSSLLAIGDDIVITGSGVTKTKVFDIVDGTHILTLDNMVNAVTEAEVSFYAPTILKGGALAS